MLAEQTVLPEIHVLLNEALLESSEKETVRNAVDIFQGMLGDDA